MLFTFTPSPITEARNRIRPISTLSPISQPQSLLDNLTIFPFLPNMSVFLFIHRACFKQKYRTKDIFFQIPPWTIDIEYALPSSIARFARIDRSNALLKRQYKHQSSSVLLLFHCNMNLHIFVSRSSQSISNSGKSLVLGSP